MKDLVRGLARMWRANCVRFVWFQEYSGLVLFF